MTKHRPTPAHLIWMYYAWRCIALMEIKAPAAARQEPNR